MTLGVAIALVIVDVVAIGSIADGSRALLLSLGAVLFAVSAGLTIGEVVARFKEDGFRWHSYYVWLLAFAVVLTFTVAPSRMGDARARLQLRPESSGLPKVELANADSQRTWRLLEVVEGNAILVSLASEPHQNLFRVVSLSEIKAVASTAQPAK
jgi:hypothetical protein